MPVCFISYRREDSAGHAGRLFDRLREHFGKDQVFLDVVGIDAGVDFVDTLDKAVGACDVLLAVIGRDWLTCCDKQGRRRLDDPNDFIRAEISAALKRDVRVVPVLMEGAEMPPTDALPEELKRLTRRQAVELRDSRWDADVEALIATLEKQTARPGTAPPPPAAPPAIRAEPPRQERKPVLLWGIGALAAVLIAVGLALWSPWEDEPDRPPNGPTQENGQPKEPEPTPTGRGQVEPTPTGGGQVEPTPAGGGQDGGQTEETPSGPRTVSAPNLVGLSLDEARERLRAAGLAVGDQEAKQTAEAPAQRVLSQWPRPGKELDPGTRVDLVYAVPPPDLRVEIPNVVGVDMRQAMDTLRGAGFEIARKSEPSAETRNQVLRQEPAAGSRVEKGTRVNLVYAVPLPPTGIEVPNVVGVDVRQAMDTLRGAGLDFTRRSEPSTETQNKVLRQEPSAGSRVEKGTKVTLFYAVPLPPTGIAVPNVVGMDVQQAMDTLRNAGLDPARRSEPSTETQHKVIRQEPAAGSRVEKGTRVTVVYAAGVTRATTVFIYYASEADRRTAEGLASYLRGLGLEGTEYKVSTSNRGLETGKVFYSSEEHARLARAIAGRSGSWLSSTYNRRVLIATELDLRVSRTALFLTMPGSR